MKVEAASLSKSTSDRSSLFRTFQLNYREIPPSVRIEPNVLRVQAEHATLPSERAYRLPASSAVRVKLGSVRWQRLVKERERMSDVWAEYHEAAVCLARRGLTGDEGDPLPDLISETAENLIDDDLGAFKEHVRAAGDLLAMEELRVNRVDPLLSGESMGAAKAEPHAAETTGREIAESKLALLDFFSPEDLSALDPLCQPAEPLVAHDERSARAA
jgi:hypothetical protein